MRRETGKRIIISLVAPPLAPISLIFALREFKGIRKVRTVSSLVKEVLFHILMTVLIITPILFME